MQLKWRIEAITAAKIEPQFAATGTEARQKCLAVVEAIAATDPVLGPAFLARAKAVSFASPKVPWHVDMQIQLDPAAAHFLDNYVRVDAWWE